MQTSPRATCRMRRLRRRPRSIYLITSFATHAAATASKRQPLASLSPDPDYKYHALVPHTADRVASLRAPSSDSLGRAPTVALSPVNPLRFGSLTLLLTFLLASLRMPLLMSTLISPSRERPVLWLWVCQSLTHTPSLLLRASLSLSPRRWRSTQAKLSLCSASPLRLDLARSRSISRRSRQHIHPCACMLACVHACMLTSSAQLDGRASC